MNRFDQNVDVLNSFTDSDEFYFGMLTLIPAVDLHCDVKSR